MERCSFSFRSIVRVGRVVGVLHQAGRSRRDGNVGVVVVVAVAVHVPLPLQLPRRLVAVLVRAELQVPHQLVGFARFVDALALGLVGVHLRLSESKRCCGMRCEIHGSGGDLDSKYARHVLLL